MAVPQHHPRPVPAGPATQAPRHLHAVPRPRRRLIPAAIWTVVIIVIIILFALVVFHAVIVDGQTTLDGLNDRIEDVRVENEKLQLYVGRAEAPDRIITEALLRLGMVEPENLTYLSPVEPPGSGAG